MNNKWSDWANGQIPPETGHVSFLIALSNYVYSTLCRSNIFMLIYF